MYLLVVLFYLFFSVVCVCLLVCVLSLGYIDLRLVGYLVVGVIGVGWLVYALVLV